MKIASDSMRYRNELMLGLKDMVRYRAGCMNVSYIKESVKIILRHVLHHRECHYVCFFTK